MCGGFSADGAYGPHKYHAPTPSPHFSQSEARFMLTHATIPNTLTAYREVQLLRRDLVELQPTNNNRVVAHQATKKTICFAALHGS